MGVRNLLAALMNNGIAAAGQAAGAVLGSGVKRDILYFPFVSEALSVVPFSFGWKFRRAAYARILPGMGHDAVVHFGVTIEDPRTVIGSDVWIGSNVYLDYVIIEDSVLVGPHAALLSGGRHHRTDDLSVPIKQQGNPPKEPVVIGRGAWIGSNATVMADVGHDAIVGAGAVVTRPVEPFAIVAGNPAKVLRMRDGREGARPSSGEGA